MKLQQLRYLAAVVQSDLNITAAALKVRATQSAISKQLKLLEDELGFSIFARSGRMLTRVTPAGERVIRHGLKILRETGNIQGLSEDFKDAVRGSLSIGTTHTEARYVLPAILQKFRQRYPNVQFHLHQGTPEQIAAMAEWIASTLRWQPVRKSSFRTTCCYPTSGRHGSWFPGVTP